MFIHRPPDAHECERFQEMVKGRDGTHLRPFLTGSLEISWEQELEKLCEEDRVWLRMNVPQVFQKVL